MKKLFSLSLMIGGLAGSVFAVPSLPNHNTHGNTAATTKIVRVKKNQQLATIPWPEPGNSKKPC
jgi:hypothetical protein